MFLDAEARVPGCFQFVNFTPYLEITRGQPTRAQSREAQTTVSVRAVSFASFPDGTALIAFAVVRVRLAKKNRSWFPPCEPQNVRSMLQRTVRFKARRYTSMKTIQRQIVVVAALVGALALMSVQAQQVPIPQTAAEVPGPPPGTTMTKEYVQMVGRMAYVWGWPLVNSANRAAGAAKLPEPMIVGGMPAAYGRLVMLTGYMSPDERIIECPNQDVVYGVAFVALDKEPIVFQVPDFGDRFWVYALYDERTDEYSQIGKAYGTNPGFYLMVGPDWRGEKPAGITAVVRSSTNLAFGVPRIFMDDSPEDHAAVQPIINQIDFYPLSEFNGKMKIKDWSKAPHIPAPWPKDQKTELQNVNPETFFDQLPAIMKEVPPMPGEESLYKWIGSVLDAAAKDPEIKKTLQETAIATEREMITPVLMQWRLNGRPAGNGWNSPINNAQWGTDYLNRTATARSNML
jgi:hypothetical protein